MVGSAEILCPRCQGNNPPNARYCNQCGAMLHALRQTGASHHDERRVATVLFADVKDSTRAIAELDAEAAKLKLEPFLDAMIAAVTDHGGTVVKLQGDGVMASFGVVEPLEDHAVAACRAALQIRRHAEAANAALAVRVGINTGEVIVSHDRPGGLDISGPMVHLASRLEQSADANAILISQTTFRECRSLCTGQPRGPMTFKGFDRPQEVWELLDVRGNSRWEARAASGLSAFVGRRQELDLLEAIFAAFIDQRIGQSICIAGDAGCGKSRLAHEAMALGSLWQCAIWEAHTEPASRHSPYAAARQLLRQWLGLSEQDAVATVGERLDAIVEQSKVVLGPHHAALRAMLNVPSSAPFLEAAEPQQRRSEYARAFRAVCRQQAKSGPLLILQEDIHWCDGESLALLSAVVDGTQDSAICLVATARPMDDAARERLPRFAHRLELAEFSVAEADDFLDATLGQHPSIAPIKAQLADQTGRLPFFLDEMVKHLVAAGRLTGEPGAYVWQDAKAELDTPSNVQALATARIAGLPSPLRAAVVRASAIGRRFPLALMAELLETDLESARQMAQRLADRHILTIYDQIAGSECEFRHQLLREAAYGMVMRGNRPELHAKILHAAESLFENRLSDWLGFLAHHAGLAERAAETVRYNRLAAEKAVEASAYGAARQYCEQALEALAKLPPTPENRTEAIDIKLLLRVAVGATSDFEPWLRHLSEAIDIAAELGDVRRRVLATVHRTWALNFAGSAVDAVRAGENALQLAGTLQAPETESLARFALGQAAYAHGAYARAIEVLGPAVAWLQGERETLRIGTTGTTLVLCRTMRANAYASRGRFAEAAEDLQQMAQIVGKTERIYDSVMLAYGRGTLDVYRGQLPAALDELRRGYQACTSAEINLFLPLIAGLLGTALVAAGAIEEADEVLRSGMRTAEAVGHGVARTAIIIGQAGVLLAKRRPSEAATLAEQAYALAEQRGHRGLSVAAGRVAAQAIAALAPNDLDRPAALLSRAIALAEEIGAIPPLLSCLGLYGNLLLRHKRIQEGIAALEHAAQICASLGFKEQAAKLDQAIAAARSG